jgi:hypothetical protein
MAGRRPMSRRLSALIIILLSMFWFIFEALKFDSQGTPPQLAPPLTLTAHAAHVRVTPTSY